MKPGRLFLLIVGILFVAVVFQVVVFPVGRPAPGSRKPGGASAVSTSDHGTLNSEVRSAISREPRDEPLANLILRWKTESNREARETLEAQIEASLTSENASQVVRMLAPDFSATSLGLVVLERWATIAPAAAAEWVRGSAQDAGQQLAVVVRAWFGTDQTGFSDYIKALPAGEWRNTVLAGAAVESLQDGRPRDAAFWLMELPSERRSDEMLSTVMSMWGQSDFQSATSWIMSQDDPILQDRLLTAMLGGYAHDHPAEAARFALTVFETGEPLSRAMELIVPAWSNHDAQGAAEWIKRLPEPELRREALDVLLPVWLGKDASAARDWVLALPSATDQSESVYRIAQWAAQNNPEFAVSLLQCASSVDMRPSVQVGILRQWARWDFVKANTWAHQLPEGPLRDQAMIALTAAAAEPHGVPY